MLIEVPPSALRQTKWHEYAIRFLFGGAITVIAGMIAKRYGPELGGLFLAFPAIFPAAATLAQKHEVQKKEKKGLSGQQRGIDAAGAEAAGAALGSIGLVAFALLFWMLVTRNSLWIVFPVALVGWSVVSVIVWLARKRWHPFHRPGRGLAVDPEKSERT